MITCKQTPQETAFIVEHAHCRVELVRTPEGTLLFGVFQEQDGNLDTPVLQLTEENRAFLLNLLS